MPLQVAAVPEAPYVFLNVLSMAAIAAFAWYIRARLPTLPAWLVWGWLMMLPWTLELSTHLINPSYVLAPSIAFFIGFFEAVPVFRLGKIPLPVAFGLMGAATAWILQIHMSWPLLLPYAALAWAAGWRLGTRRMATNAASFAGGFMVFGALLIPTFLVYGLHGGSGGTLKNLQPHPVNPWIAVTTLARMFSFASLEIWRFIAVDEGKRWMLFVRHPWIVPFTAVALVAGLWQPIWMLREWFRQRSPFPEWPSLKWLVAGTVMLVYASYWFVYEPPQARAFYLVAPITFLFAAYCWTFVDSPRWRQIAAITLAINVLFHAGMVLIQGPEHSIYRNREVVAAAIRLKEPQMFGHRRAIAVDGGPSALDPTSRPYDGRRDLQFTDVRFTLGSRRVALWTLTLRNTNPGVAYRDVTYLATYRDQRGEIVEQRSHYIEDIFQPETATMLELNDGIFAPDFASSTIEVLSAEALLPIR